MTSINVGVITQSKGAHLGAYFSSLAETPEVARVAVADESGECFASARRILKDKLQSEYRSAAKMLSEVKPAMAVVSMEAVNAPPMIDAALDAGCHVLAEKPSCIRSEDFEPLVEKAERKHLEVMLALANRVHSPVQEARRVLSEGLLGKLYAVNMHLVADQARLQSESYRNLWYCQKARAGGGHLTWLGIHWLDLAMYITGLRVQKIGGFINVVGGQPIDVEDSASISLQFNDGVLGTMLSGYYVDKTFKANFQGYHSRIQIWGEDGWLRLAKFEDQPLEWYSARTPGKPAIQQYKDPTGSRSYQPFVRAAVRASARLAEPPITSKESLHVLQAIYAFYKGAETGQMQEVAAMR